MQKNTRRVLAGVAAAAAMIPFAGQAQAAPNKGVITGPSSSQSPYLLPIAPGVSTTSILTVGDKADNGYQMVGIPDGLGMYRNADGTVTLLMNHEYGATAGAVRDHGARGSYVSTWVIDPRTMRVLEGSDLIKKLILADPKLGQAMSRLCSADLADLTAYYNPATGKGYDGRIFTNGEEDGATGRAFAHVATGPEAGTSYELAGMGNAAWENVVANPLTGDKTVVIGTDDSTPGQVYLYLGEKKSTGTAIDKAGLTGGTLFGIRAAGGLNEYDRATKDGNPTFPLSGRFDLANLGNADSLDVASTQALSDANKVTEWWRPEDGAWSTTDRNVFYFTTTAKFDGPTRLWKLTFVDVTRPELGGTFEAVLDGTEGAHMFDNMAAAENGKQVLLNEDPGNTPYLARVYSYSIGRDRLTPVLQHDPARFTTGGAQFLTQDEESSGTIDVSEFFGHGTFLMTTQAHYKLPEPLVEGGQLQLVRVPWTDHGAGNGKK